MSGRPGHSTLCDSDDCPCFRAGQDATRLALAERSGETFEAMTRLTELLGELVHESEAL